jgi:hypothetical protein
MNTENETDTNFAMRGELYKVAGTIYDSVYGQELPFVSIQSDYYYFTPEDLEAHVMVIKEHEIIYYFLMDTAREIQLYQLQNAEEPWKKDY